MVSSGIGVLVGCGSFGDVGSFLVACVAVFLVCSDLLDTGVAVLVLVGRLGLLIAALGGLGLGSFLDSGAGLVTVLFLRVSGGGSGVFLRWTLLRRYTAVDVSTMYERSSSLFVTMAFCQFFFP